MATPVHLKTGIAKAAALDEFQDELMKSASIRKSAHRFHDQLSESSQHAIANYAGHMQNPNAPEPEQLFSVAPEIAQINTPMLFLIGEQNYELRRMNGGRAFYSLYEREVPVEMQYYPLARQG